MSCPECGCAEYREFFVMDNKKCVECSNCKMQYTIPLPAPRKIIVVDNVEDI